MMGNLSLEKVTLANHPRDHPESVAEWRRSRFMLLRLQLIKQLPHPKMALKRKHQY